MKLKKVSFGKNFPSDKLGDYMVYDQVTGYKIWRRDAVILDKFTGHGGLLTHKDVAKKYFNIDYGLVPYKIPAELPVGRTTSNHITPDVYNSDTMFEFSSVLKAQDDIAIVFSDGSYIAVTE